MQNGSLNYMEGVIYDIFQVCFRDRPVVFLVFLRHF